MKVFLIISIFNLIFLNSCNTREECNTKCWYKLTELSTEELKCITELNWVLITNKNQIILSTMQERDYNTGILHNFDLTKLCYIIHQDSLMVMRCINKFDTLQSFKKENRLNLSVVDFNTLDNTVDYLLFDKWCNSPKDLTVTHRIVFKSKFSNNYMDSIQDIVSKKTNSNWTYYIQSKVNYGL